MAISLAQAAIISVPSAHSRMSHAKGHLRLMRSQRRTLAVSLCKLYPSSQLLTWVLHSILHSHGSCAFTHGVRLLIWCFPSSGPDSQCQVYIRVMGHDIIVGSCFAVLPSLCQLHMAYTLYTQTLPLQAHDLLLLHQQHPYACTGQ